MQSLLNPGADTKQDRDRISEVELLYDDTIHVSLTLNIVKEWQPNESPSSLKGMVCCKRPKNFLTSWLSKIATISTGPG